MSVGLLLGLVCLALRTLTPSVAVLLPVLESFTGEVTTAVFRTLGGDPFSKVTVRFIVLDCPTPSPDSLMQVTVRFTAEHVHFPSSLDADTNWVFVDMVSVTVMGPGLLEGPLFVTLMCHVPCLKTFQRDPLWVFSTARSASWTTVTELVAGGGVPPGCGELLTTVAVFVKTVLSGKDGSVSAFTVTVQVVFFGSFVRSQVNCIWLLTAQGCPLPSTETIVSPWGMLSVMITSRASAGPLFFTSTLNAVSAPALTGLGPRVVFVSSNATFRFTGSDTSE